MGYWPFMEWMTHATFWRRCWGNYLFMEQNSTFIFGPKMFVPLILLLNLILLPIISSIPFNRFPVTSHGISQLSNVMLAQYQQELVQLEGKVREIERSIGSTEVLFSLLNRPQNPQKFNL
jgi:hypothetical protein